MSITSEQLIAAVRANGNDARDLRDAAHEAHHALEAKVKRGKWDRETIHCAVMKMGLGRAIQSEIMARAVEQIVCADLCADCGTVEEWAMVACMEALKSRIQVPGLDWMVARIKAAMVSPEGRKAADAVLALAKEEK